MDRVLYTTAPVIHAARGPDYDRIVLLGDDHRPLTAKSKDEDKEAEIKAKHAHKWAAYIPSHLKRGICSQCQQPMFQKKDCFLICTYTVSTDPIADFAFIMRRYGNIEQKI
jgi:hypothetical protein